MSLLPQRPDRARRRVEPAKCPIAGQDIARVMGDAGCTKPGGNSHPPFVGEARLKEGIRAGNMSAWTIRELQSNDALMH